MGKLYFQTCAYNAEKTVARCVDSVLNQTKYGENIEYWIMNHGSTDKTLEILQEYARNDSRIRMFHCDINNERSSVTLRFWSLPSLIRDDDYFCFIDSDDEYKLDFLENAIPFIEDNCLDMMMGGNDFIDATTGSLQGQRVLSQAVILEEPQKFADFFPIYHQFARTIWGKIISGRVARRMLTWENCPLEWWTDLPYGFDTLQVFSAARNCKRIGIFPKTFYKYYVSKKSISHNWQFCRIECDQILNKDAEDFLSQFGSISVQNRHFLNRVYANAVSDSIAVLCSAEELSDEEKLRELRKAVDYRVTTDMMADGTDEVLRCRVNIFHAALKFGMGLRQENDDLRTALRLICPKCEPLVRVDELGLYARESALQKSLLNDDETALVSELLRLIEKGAYSKQFDLLGIVAKSVEGRGLAANITDAGFIKAHGDIYLLIWQKKYVQALDNMTETLHKKKWLDETFLQTYLTLAAMLEGVDEFVLGKVKLAAFYCGEKRRDECRAALNDLSDMGVEDNEEILDIKAKLNGK